MATVSSKRVWIGALVGGLVWVVWGVIINFLVVMSHYLAAQGSGLMLKEPRYPFFMIVWILGLFGLAWVGSWLYANVRATLGPGPRTAVKVGLVLGLAAGFPVNFYISAWVPFSRFIPFGWLLELGVGAVLATLVAGFMYRES